MQSKFGTVQTTRGLPRFFILIFLILILVASSCTGTGEGKAPGQSPTTSPRYSGTPAPTTGTNDTTPGVFIPVTSTTTVSSNTTTTIPVDVFGETTAVDPVEGSLVELPELGVVALGRLNVMFTEDATAADVAFVAEAVNGEVIGFIEYINLYQYSMVTATPEALITAIATVTELNGVLEAFPETAAVVSEIECVSTSPLNSSQYQEGDNAGHYEAIGLSQAWDIIDMSGIKLNKVHVGVVDTAIEVGNSEIVGSPATRIHNDTQTVPPNEAAEAADASNGIEHGTAVTNVIAANPDNGGVVGVASVLRENLTITTDDIFTGPSWQVAGPNATGDSVHTIGGTAYTSATLSKIISQVQSGVTVINMSFGPTTPEAGNQGVSAAYKAFFTKMSTTHPDVVFVAAAGNENGALSGANYFPGGMALPNVITVGAIDQNGNKASFSNTNSGGGEITLAAPGVDIPVGVGDATGTTRLMSGTSFATPMVTGTIALLQSINPKLTATEIKTILEQTAMAGVPARTGDTSVLVPEDVGGRVLRVDEAVLAVINGMRAKAEPPQAPLTKESLLELASFNVSSEIVSIGEFDVAATVSQVNGEATLSFDLMAEGAVNGDSHVTLTEPGGAQWDVTVAAPNEAASAKICRVEASRCCTVILESIDIPGTYEGLLTITQAVAEDDIVIDVGMGDPQVITKEECQESATEMIGQSFPISLTLAGEPGATSGGVTGYLTNADGEVSTLVPSTWTYNGTNIALSMGIEGDDGAEPGYIDINGPVTVAADGSAVITGNWGLGGIPNLVFGGIASLKRIG